MKLFLLKNDDESISKEEDANTISSFEAYQLIEVSHY
ncbi:hypothetical protein pb186bvf_001964 [Paramecium bursaria]